MYRALRDCKFDKKYSYGEIIPDSVADQGCFANAVKFGYIEMVAAIEEPVETEEVEAIEEPVEAQEVPESDSDEEAEEEPQQKRKGRKKADRGA